MDNTSIDTGHSNSGSIMLFFAAQLLNIITYMSGDHPLLKTIVAVLGILLTLVSLINGLTTMYKNAQTWYVVVIIKEQYNKRKKTKK